MTVTRSSVPSPRLAAPPIRFWLDLSRRASGAGRLVVRIAPDTPLPQADRREIASAEWSEREDGWILGRVWEFDVFEAGLALAAEPGSIVLPRAASVLGLSSRSVPLAVELVPEPCWGRSSSSVLGEEVWRRAADEFAVGAGSRCAVCGRPANLVADRYAYLEPEERAPAPGMPDLRIGVRRFLGWELSCPLCWVARRPGLATTAAASESAIDHLMSVNNWRRDDIDAAALAAWRTWRRRSGHAWRDDFSALERLPELGAARCTSPAPRPVTPRR